MVDHSVTGAAATLKKRKTRSLVGHARPVLSIGPGIESDQLVDLSRIPGQHLPEVGKSCCPF